jgi:hypothetical protein
MRLGWHSIWFIAGTTPVASIIFSRADLLKLDTPIALTLSVSLEIRISSFQVATIPGASVSMTFFPSATGWRSLPGLKGTGQWMR